MGRVVRPLHALPTGNGRISVYHAADLSTLPLRPTCFPRYFLHLGYDWSLCLSPSLLPYGVTSMSFRPGCHRPFHRSYCLRSLPLLSQDCVLSSFGSVSFASAIPDIVLQHVPTSTVVTLRPFALYLPSWRILLLVAVDGLEPSLILLLHSCCSCGYGSDASICVSAYRLSLPYVKPVLFSRTPGERINTI